MGKQHTPCYRVMQHQTTLTQYYGWPASPVAGSLSQSDRPSLPPLTLSTHPARQLQAHMHRYQE